MHSLKITEHSQEKLRNKRVEIYAISMIVGLSVNIDFLSKLIDTCNEMSIKMSQTFFFPIFSPDFLKEMCWLILRVLWKYEGSRMVKTIFK